MKNIKLLTTDDNSWIWENYSENRTCLCEPGIVCLFLVTLSVIVVSDKMEDGFPVKLRDFLLRANVCGRGRGGEKPGAVGGLVACKCQG